MGQVLKSKADLDELFSALKRKETFPPENEVKSGDASWMHWRLVSMICDFEDELTDEQEVAVEVLGRTVGDSLYLETISFWNPDMIVLHGTDSDGDPKLIAHHTSQLCYALTAAPKIHEIAARVSEALKAALPER